MKKMKFFAMAMMMVGAFTLSLTSCTKTEDVDYNDAPDYIVHESKAGGGFPLNCPLCAMEGVNTMVAPDEHHEHIYNGGECPYGADACTLYDKHHHHIFWNEYHSATNGGLHTEITTHCGGSQHSCTGTVS